MTRPILDPAYWANRLRSANCESKLFHAVYVCAQERWDEIGAKHREILAAHVWPTTTVLDVGCGYGRLLGGLMPPRWRGTYLGVDLSPEFVAMARRTHGHNLFMVHDFRDPLPVRLPKFDLAVMVSVRGMVVRECGADLWAVMERNVRLAADKLLFLEYDATDPGSLE